MRTKLLGLFATIAVSSLWFASCGGGTGQTNGNSTTSPESASTPGCYVPSDSVGNVGCGLLSSFGDPTADAMFGMEVNVQTQFWQGIPASVQVLDDCNGANAFSLPNGNIVYGIRLFQQLVVSYGGDAGPISGVLAHEWGHQVQFDNGWFVSTEPTSRPIELEADAFSGYYMALGETYSWQSISDYLQAVANTGDFNFTDPSHHGTPQERLAAAQLGFQTAEQAAATQTPLTYSDLHQIFSSSISTFAARKSATPEASSASAQTVLSRLDLQEVYNILDGATHGRDRVIRRTPELKNLYPTP